MNLQPTPAPDPVEANRKKDVDNLIGNEKPSENGEGHCGNDLAAYARREKHGSDGDDGHTLGEQFRPQAVDGTFDDGFPKFFQGFDVLQAVSTAFGCRPSDKLIGEPHVLEFVLRKSYSAIRSSERAGSTETRSGRVMLGKEAIA